LNLKVIEENSQSASEKEYLTSDSKVKFGIEDLNLNPDLNQLD